MVDALMAVLDNPWIAIWMSPRETIRKIVDRDPTYHVMLLAALAGALAMLNSALAAAFGEASPMLPARLVPYLPIWTLVSPFVGAAAGIGGLYAGAFVFEWAGRALGGVADSRAVRAAIAWAEVPQVCFGAATMAVLMVIGVGQALSPSLPPADPAAAAAAAKGFTAGRGIAAIISLWSFIVFLHCLGEVHGFSTWRALGAFVLVTAVLVLATLAVRAALA